MLEAFDKYVQNYDLNEKNIKLKYNHSYRVTNLSKKYAQLLNFSKEDIEIASIIGLLHDIGRFEQYKNFSSFDDSKNIDHADYSVHLLFEQNQIKDFNIPEKYYETIEFAIKNHNKLSIPYTTNKKALMHAKLIRDTDKIDIIYLLGYLKEYKLKVTDEPISEAVINEFNKHQTININLWHNTNDQIVAKFAFAFDINNAICLKEIKENYKYFYERLNNEKFKPFYLEILKYIDERIDNNA